MNLTQGNKKRPENSSGRFYFKRILYLNPQFLSMYLHQWFPEGI